MARAIKYQRKGFQPQTVLTSLTDAKQFPAKDVVARYHERWKLELGYDEIKTPSRDDAVTGRRAEEPTPSLRSGARMLRI